MFCVVLDLWHYLEPKQVSQYLEAVYFHFFVRVRVLVFVRVHFFLFLLCLWLILSLGGERGLCSIRTDSRREGLL